MGSGWFHPSGNAEGVFWYRDEDEDDMSWHDDVENIVSLLPKSYTKVKHRLWIDNSERVIAENRQFYVTMAYWNDTQALVVRVKDDSDNLAVANLWRSAKAVFDRLSSEYVPELFHASGGFGPASRYQVGNKVAA